MRQTDVLVLGQGLAGSLMSYRLGQAQIDHLVIDRGHEQASSRAAAGLVNPVTGRRFVLSWRTPELLKGLQVYRELESLLDTALLSELLILRDLTGPKALNQWDMRRGDPAYAPYMGQPLLNGFKAPEFDLPAALGPTQQAYRVDLPELIARYCQHLLEAGRLIEAEVSIDSATRIDEGYQLGPVSAKRIIDCTGAAAITTRTWGDLPWRGTKGQALCFDLPAWPRSQAVKQRSFVAPVGTQQRVWVGGTNEDNYEDARPTDAALKNLSEQAATSGITLPQNLRHLSAIRPTTRHRRPFVGEHPRQSKLYLCNGLGTKGASLAPYCTEQLANHLSSGALLDEEIDVRAHGPKG